MADRAANAEGVGTRLALFTRSLVALAAIVVAVPWALIFAARQRFGGGAPLHGVPSPADWSASRIGAALTDRLTDQTVADVVIRVALVVAWVGVIVLVLTVIAEIVHMLRHDGLAMPDVRGFGVSQRAARVIASGLLTVVPLFTSPSAAVALDTNSVVPASPIAATLIEAPTSSPTASPSVAPGLAEPERAGPGQYVVKTGDSIFGIAERLAGPESAHVAALAEQLVDLNMGRPMPDGRHFTNAAFIDVGWVLEIPNVDAANPVAGPASASTAATDDVHVVAAGESLWSIADDELGDPTRWPEVYDANAGRTFDDGRALGDPDLIQPGWDLQLPSDVEAPSIEVTEPTEPTQVVPLAEVEPTAPERGVPTHLADSIDPGGTPNADTSAAVPSEAPSSARRDNVWDEAAPAVAATGEAVAESVDESVAESAEASDDGSDEQSSSLLVLGGAAMLSAGILTLLGVRRRNQLRRARPRATLPEPAERAAATERRLRSIDAGERLVRVEMAIRGVAVPVIERSARVISVLVAPDGALELRTSGPAELPAPWEGGSDLWRLAASTPLEILVEAAAGVGAPCPTLVQLGTDEAGRDVYVDLEAVEAVEIGGPGAHADAIVAAVAATLSGSVLAEVTTLVGLGVPDDAFLGHRRYTPVRDGQRAFEAAADAIGSTASMTRSTFELRATGTATETWEPAVVLVGAAAGSITPPTDRTGLAVVSASPIQGPSSRLAPDGDTWLLLPLGVRLRPIGLTPDDISAIAELVDVVEPEPQLDRSGLDDDHTIVGGDAAPTSAVASVVAVAPVEAPEPPPHELLVRLIGPVEVIDLAGAAVSFERSKTRELVAWLATHRERSTRQAARTALWELDVRDATFANVVSEARRSLARLVEPPAGEEWVGRTMTEALPLHELVLTDADVIRHALRAARVQPPAQAIATLAPAVELIAGMPFEGTSYLWPDSEGLTSNLVLLATTATTELGAHCLSIGDIEGVFDATGRGLQVLPAHEELIGLRMEAHAKTGDHAGVRQEWESYERVINADPWSDGEPAAKLVELRQRLLNPSR